jgi:hypothetical protein
VKSQCKTNGTEEKLDVISWLERDEQIFDIFHNVRLSHICILQFIIMLTELPEVLGQ